MIIDKINIVFHRHVSLPIDKRVCIFLAVLSGGNKKKNFEKYFVIGCGLF